VIRLQKEGWELQLSVAPKCGSCSLFAWGWRVANGHPYPGVLAHLHDMRPWEEYAATLPSLPKDRIVSIAVHRNGLQRLLSAYRQRIAEHPQAQEVRNECSDVEQFARHLPLLAAKYHDVATHTAPQSVQLGTSFNCYNIVCPSSRLNDLPRAVSLITGLELPAIETLNATERTSVQPSAFAVELLEAFCAYDTAVGWDGITAKGMIDV